MDITTVIMAGGKSSRMGVDKSFAPLLGRPMIEQVLDRVAGLGDELIIITNKPADYAYLQRPLFGDIYPEKGPLGGLHAALHYASHPYILVVACDMPWLNPSLLEYMITLRQTADAIVPRWTKFPEPLHAIYSKACLAPIAENLARDQLKMVLFYGRVKVRYLEREEIARFDPEGRSFRNVNTPEDLAAAEDGE